MQNKTALNLLDCVLALAEVEKIYSYTIRVAPWLKNQSQLKKKASATRKQLKSRMVSRRRQREKKDDDGKMRDKVEEELQANEKGEGVVPDLEDVDPVVAPEQSEVSERLCNNKLWSLYIICTCSLC